MYNFIVRLIACFIPNKSIRRTFRAKYLRQTVKDKILLLDKQGSVASQNIENINQILSGKNYADFVINGENNKVIIVYEDKHEEELTHPLDGLKIHINGNNNVIKLPSVFGVQNSFLDINSDGLFLEIEPTIWFHNVWLRSYAGINQYVHIGRDTSFEQAYITVADKA